MYAPIAVKLLIQTKTELDYCFYSRYEPIHIVWAPAVDDGYRFGHHLQRRASDLSKIQVGAQLN